MPDELSSSETEAPQEEPAPEPQRMENMPWDSDVESLPASVVGARGWRTRVRAAMARMRRRVAAQSLRRRNRYGSATRDSDITVRIAPDVAIHPDVAAHANIGDHLSVVAYPDAGNPSVITIHGIEPSYAIRPTVSAADPPRYGRLPGADRRRPLHEQLVREARRIRRLRQGRPRSNAIIGDENADL